MMKLAAKAAAVLSAAVMLSAAAGMTVQAAEKKVNIEIEKVTVDTASLKEMDYRVPVKVMLTANPGVNAVEFGVKVDERCTFEIVSEAAEETPDGELMLTSMTTSTKGANSWLVWASAKPMTRTGVLAYFYVTVPETAGVGDKFTLDYCPEIESIHLWNDTETGTYYADLNEISWQDGCISVKAVTKGELMGDINCDKQVNLLDVLALNRNLLIGEELTEEGILNADVDGDGKPTAVDALLVLKYTIGLVGAL